MEGIQPSDEFVNQFSGSATANLVFVAALLLFRGLKTLCQRDSKCHSKFHMCCCDLDIQDRTVHENPLEDDSEGGIEGGREGEQNV